jgi:hypothetical protein
MAKEPKSAAECRQRADDCRALADRMKDDQRRQQMLKVAETWEILARQSERTDWTDRAI